MRIEWKKTSRIVAALLCAATLALPASRAQAQTNVLSNPGLETDSSPADSWPDGWTLSSGTPTSAQATRQWLADSTSVDSNHPTGAGHGVMVEGWYEFNSGTSAYDAKKDPNLLRNPITGLTVGTTYEYGAWVRGSVGGTIPGTTQTRNGTTLVSISFYSTTGIIGTAFNAANNKSSTSGAQTQFGWTYITGTAIVPTGTVRAAITIGLTNGSLGKIYIDDVTLKSSVLPTGVDTPSLGGGTQWKLYEQKAADGTVTFSGREEFDGTSLNTNFWIDKWTSCCGQDQWYQKYGSVDANGVPNNNLTVANGKLTITARKQTVVVDAPTVENPDNKITYNYTSGMVVTRPAAGYPGTGLLMQQDYGFVEGRITISKNVKGFWPGFWLKAKQLSNAGMQDDNGAFYAPPENDIMESIGETDTIYHNYHYFDPTKLATEPPNANSLGKPALVQSLLAPNNKVVKSGLSAGLHTFGTQWSPTEIVWYIDGVETKRLTKGVNGQLPFGVYRKNMFIVLNLAVGGTWPATTPPDTAFPATMDVDYVRVWTAADAAGNEVVAPATAPCGCN